MDITNIKILIAFFYANTPDKRRLIGDPLEILTEGTWSDEKLKEIEALIGGPFEDGIKGKAHATVAFSMQLMKQLIKWDFHLVYIGEKENQEFITSDKPVCCIRISPEKGFSTNEGWEYFDRDGRINLFKKLDEIIIPQDMIFYFPLNPKTAIFLYHKPKEKQHIPNFEDNIQYVNFAQFAHCREFIIGQNKTILERVYNEINDLTS